MTTELRHDGLRLIAVVGPSGVGKDSVLAAWRRRLGPTAPVHFARRVITRPADPSGENHEALSVAAFTALAAQGGFGFCWQANGLQYAVRKSELAMLAGRGWVVLNTSRAALPELRQAKPGVRVVELRAPPQVLRRRLEQRGREAAPAIAARLSRTTFAIDAALVLDNGTRPLDESVESLHAWWLSLRDDPGPA